MPPAEHSPQSPSATWQVLATSVRGLAHHLNHQPAQDRFLSISFQINGLQQIQLLLAADGAGSASKSWAGAWAACRTVAEAVRQLTLTPSGRHRLISPRAWQAGLAAELFARARQGLCSWAEVLKSEHVELATTLNMAVLSPGFWAFGMVGDGLIAAQASRLESVWQVHGAPHRGEFAGETVFLTSDNWREHFQSGVVEGAPDRLLMTTDGLLPVLYQSQSGTIFESFVNPLFAAAESPHFLEEEKTRQLGKFLESDRVRARCDDDLTLILASRRRAEVDESPSAS